MDSIDFAKLTIPAGYNEIVSEIISKCNNSDFTQTVTNYSTCKEQLGLPQQISPLSNLTLQSPEFLPKQTVMLSQAEYLGKIAKSAPIEAKPILYHYAENSLFSFFVYSIIAFTPTHSSSHGMQIRWNSNIDDIEVSFSDSGFFSRIVDCYTICGCESSFSSIEYNKTSQSFTGRQHAFSLRNNPTIKVKDLIQHRLNLGSTSSGFQCDVIDFVLLFVCSSLARYRPYMWIELTRGEKGTQFIWFNQCFSRFDILMKRLKDTIIHFKNHGTQGTCLDIIDPKFS